DEGPEDHLLSADRVPFTPAAATTHDLICTHDLDGRILSVNSAACETLGLPASTLQKMTIQELLPPVAAEGFASYIHTLRHHGFAVGMMTIMTAKGERRVWEYRNALDQDDTSGSVVRGVAWDVTQRERAFQAVRRSEEYFRSIIENTSDIIVIVGLNGKIRYESPSVERVLGCARDAHVGSHIIDLFHPEDAGRVAEFLVGQIADPKAIQSIELRALHQAGTWRSFEIVANNLAKIGHAPAIVMNARDITERKLLEAQLVQANRLGGLGRLAATVAHEFNNVLMGMQPFAELMQRPDASPQIVSKGAWHIANSIQRGKRIVLDILRFTRPWVPVTATIDLGEWWQTFAPEAEAVLGNAVVIESTIPRHGLHAIADRTQLSQVMANLVANARDAMPGGGKLTVHARELAADMTFPFGVVPNPDRFVQISISDDGCGMAAEVMDRVFEPLYTTRQSGGTGLGLAVAHQVLTQHGGYIFVESEVREGSTFHLFLPRAASAPGQTRVGRPAKAPAARKLLIIDDEESIVQGIAELLGHDGMEVQSIGSGFQAAQAIASFQPHVVLLDFGLPGMDGGEVYARIRALQPSLPIIFATGHGDRQLLHDKLDDPRTRFLQKPFEVADLLAMMVDLETEGRS
ncbi:MAG: Blue-light-activated protein, partial [Acidobacteria bacterium]|nr:Blue-light-activated protein [Acidobacteriota bacterium]